MLGGDGVIALNESPFQSYGATQSCIAVLTQPRVE